MKYIYILVFSTFILSCNNHSQSNIKVTKNDKKESDLIFKVVQKGGYHSSDVNYYYFVDLKLVNNTDKRFDFITMTCASLINIVTDSKHLQFLIPNCSANHFTIIRLKPKQEYVLPAVLFQNSQSEFNTDNIRFGFILAQVDDFDRKGDKSPVDQLEEMRENKENVIWSESIDLSVTTYHPYQIRTIINDTTFSESQEQ
jgi:hypothetical protein